MKLFGSTNKLTDKTKDRENDAKSWIGLLWNLVDNQYQQKSEVLYTFTPNKTYGYLLNLEPNNLVFQKIYNNEFDNIFWQ